jgi:hypothetical protein
MSRTGRFDILRPLTAVSCIDARFEITTPNTKCKKIPPQHDGSCIIIDHPIEFNRQTIANKRLMTDFGIHDLGDRHDDEA